jgi:hypothetical protein
MDWTGLIYRTRLAHMIQLRPDLLEIRYKPGIIMDMDGVKEIHAMRVRLFGDRPYVNISILPDDVKFDAAIMEQDHYAPTRPMDGLHAWAVVACGAVGEHVARLYFAQFPQHFPILVTHDEGKARAWALDQLERMAKNTADPALDHDGPERREGEK